jgi:hypothetical protein
MWWWSYLFPTLLAVLCLAWINVWRAVIKPQLISLRVIRLDDGARRPRPDEGGDQE